ncbi:ADP-ribose pyrophosphatase YjhB (NUDIX family) [Natronospira proteinivora]|uniref:ADP-ribose pyrophosphatase YjhB (NUDIX family) n=1 Tax=Natronospira proteinivora TaxID=1807133 RepID=A0ABT1G4P2_9GAMM|nr:NUDIX hydrolase [Natronospira proteinivora]MCP1726261.1 ADP-ribose pyrophosphatase YjhB (NUDIX family) [Natronospira proteinivora]
MKYCSECATPISVRIPEGDSLPRYVCNHCGTIHYRNPRVVVGCVPQWQDRILLCRRAIEPRHGYWTVPAGFLENDETTREGAARETREEACAEVTIGSALSMTHVVHVNQIHLMYRAQMNQADFAAGEESLEVALFRRTEIPWDELAFPSIRFCLESYFADLDRDREDFHIQDVRRPMHPTPPAGGDS